MINKSWRKKFDLVPFSILFSDSSLDFHKLIEVVPLKYLIMYFLSGINTK